MKIGVIGTRGIPDVLGGVETHCQNLYPRLAEKGIDITIIARSPYVDYKKSEYKGVKLETVWAPKKKSFEAIVHTFLAGIRCKAKGVDLVHVHAIGPSIIVPFLKLLGLKVVFTHHGPDYERQKWGKLAKKVLMLGEKFAIRFTDEIIVISEVINNLIKEKHNRHNAHLIYNGVNSFSPVEDPTPYLSKYGLESNNYIVAVGRFVEEKGFHDLIAAYRDLNTDIPLVLVGDADHETQYSKELKQSAKATKGVHLTGFISGDELKAIFSSARLFVIPSYHEGLPIALLEAMSYSLPVVVSDIPANIEVGLDPATYFTTGNVESLKNILEKQRELAEHQKDYSQYMEKYDWAQIAIQTVNIYNLLLKKKI